MDSLVELSHALPAESSPRTEGLRSCLLRLARALRFVAQARSLRELAQEQRAMELLEISIDELVHLTAGARRRLSARGPMPVADLGRRRVHVGPGHRASRSRTRTTLARPSTSPLDALNESLRAELPPMFGGLIMNILRPLAERPLEAPKVSRSSGPQAPAPVEDRPLARVACLLRARSAASSWCARSAQVQVVPCSW